ncbi:MAG: ATP-grasp domain-containing protein [Actinomycetaceae bacterium]|nr:ATP-grasp domain-containing protein [Actinomycetaceae bacterium]
MSARHLVSPTSPVLPVVFGYDIAAYSFARIFHEAAGLRSLVVAEAARGPINDSKIFDVRLVPAGTMDDEARFLDTLDVIARQFEDRRLVLLVNTDEAVGFVAANRERLQRRWFLPYGTAEATAAANSKADMAGVIRSLGLHVPARASVDLGDPRSWDAALAGLTFPIVIKPERGSDLGAYWNQGLRKVLDLPTPEAARETFERLREGGVKARLIAQELIPGDDTTQWVVNGYIDSRGQVTACGSGRVLLGLHQPEYLGNAGIVLTEHNERLIDDAKRIVTTVGLRGFFSMDVKIDPRDGVARWLDLNPRIGRGHYYLKVAGVDLAAAMLADMEGKTFPYTTNSREAIFCIIPPQLANKNYVRDPALLRRVKTARKKFGATNPLAYGKDRHPKRTFYRLANGFNQYKRMRAWYPEPTDTGF